MKIIVDTCIWSSALRRNSDVNSYVVKKLKELIWDQRVQMIGSIRQELLSGIRSEKQYIELKSYLSVFPDLPLKMDDYELAAKYFNINRKNGIKGSNTDFLICALSYKHKMPIFTVDKDFLNFQKNIPIKLYKYI